MAHTETRQGSAEPNAAGSQRRSFWGALLGNSSYDAVTRVLFKTQRRQFIILASFPLFWVLFAHLGPILQMFWISFLDSYPPTAGVEPQLTFANWMTFFEARIFMMPFFRTLGF